MKLNLLFSIKTNLCLYKSAILISQLYIFYMLLIQHYQLFRKININGLDQLCLQGFPESLIALQVLFLRKMCL